jgi:hypothetical protein
LGESLRAFTRYFEHIRLNKIASEKLGLRLVSLSRLVIEPEVLATHRREGRQRVIQPAAVDREMEDEVKGVTFKHRVDEIQAVSMKRLSKIEAADDPSDGAAMSSRPNRVGDPLGSSTFVS